MGPGLHLRPPAREIQFRARAGSRSTMLHYKSGLDTKCITEVRVDHTKSYR